MLEKTPGIRWLLLSAFAVVASVVFLVSSASAEPAHVGGAKDFAYDAASNDEPRSEFDTPTRAAATSNGERAATAAQGPSGFNYDSSVSFVAPRTGADNALSAACRTNSFVPGTEVLMADGTTKSIEDVEVGDWVWATEPETGYEGPRQVVGTIVGDGEKRLVDIEVLGDLITATDGHPFWVDDQGVWVEAGDLEPGDRLLLADGRSASVAGVADRVRMLHVHNLTVEGIHTYYVVVADSAVLVHNCGAAKLPDLNGSSLPDAEDTLRSSGFRFHGQTEGGYIRWDHTDGSRVHIRPDGEVVRIGPLLDPGPNQRNYRQRYGPDGALTTDHNTGERVSR